MTRITDFADKLNVNQNKSRMTRITDFEDKLNVNKNKSRMTRSQISQMTDFTDHLKYPLNAQAYRNHRRTAGSKP
jgi:hypothetical protein